jgi:hypothetical protein
MWTVKHIRLMMVCQDKDMGVWTMTDSLKAIIIINNLIKNILVFD